MTLIELLVVLAILALLTTVAATSTDVFLGQGRYDATTATLSNIQESALGPPNARQADGTLVNTGIVADMGAHWFAPARTQPRPSRSSGRCQPASCHLPCGRRAIPTSLSHAGRRGPYLRCRRGRAASPMAGQPIQLARLQRQSGGHGRNYRHGAEQRLRRRRPLQRVSLGQRPTLPDHRGRICLHEGFQGEHHESDRPVLRDALRSEPDDGRCS